MDVNTKASCPCGSKISYIKCCKLFHDEIKLPSSALLLMKSRFCAFSIGNIEYIINTTHKENSDFTSTNITQWKESIKDFMDSTTFESLEILNSEIYDEYNASVTFKVNLSQTGLDVSFTEKSDFEKVNNKWLYKSGEFLD